MRSLKYHWLFVPLLCCTLAACGALKGQRPEAPTTPKDERREARGKLTGEGGIFSLGGDDKEEKGSSPLGVNSYLWRATLDTLAFMPLASADPFGGVIITDWYEDPKAPGERFKVNALILDRTLRSDGVRITVFKQKKDNGTWQDTPVNESVARELEDTILTRARQLKVRAISK